MNLARTISVLLAPAMAIDDSLSMDLYLENLLAAFAAEPDERFSFEVVVPTGADSRIGKNWNRYVEYPRLLTRHAQRTPGAVVHVLDHSYGHLCRAPLPSLMTCHGLENFKLRLPYPWHQMLWMYRVRSMRFARRVVAISEDVAADVRRFTAVPPARLSVVYYGIDAVFHPEGPAPAAGPMLAARRQAGEHLVLHVGVNIPRKNVGLVLEAIARLRGEGLPVTFVKVGTDPRTDGYADQIKRLGLEAHVVCLGWMKPDELAGVYRACDALAFPSLHEGFGRPIIEAQACGLPAVVSDTACAREIGGAGVPTHPATDAAALAAHLRAILTDPAARDAVKTAGFANIRRFSWAEHVRALKEQYLQIHREAIAGPPPPP